jgi:predicted nicotinamide N-methyase
MGQSSLAAEKNLLQTRYPIVQITVPLAERLWKINTVQDQDALIREVRTTADLDHFPYGLMLWASAVGLAARLVEEQSLVSGKRVLEIGAGIGFAGMIARSLGANLTQTDYQSDALTLCRLNAELNEIDGIEWRLADWRDLPPDLTDFDVVLGADVLYERALHADLATIFPRLVAPNGLVLLADPLRPQALEFLEGQEKTGRWTLHFEGRQVLWEGAQKDIALVHLRPIQKTP